MNIDLERVKSLTLEKIESQSKKPAFPIKRTLLIAALIAASAVLLLGAAGLFDWKVMVNGEIQQGNYGDTIIVGEGFAAMTPEKIEPDEMEVIETIYPDDTPDRIAKPGELSLFTCRAEDGNTFSGNFGVAGLESTDLEQMKRLAGNAEAIIHWPAMINQEYKVLSVWVRFYLKEEQITHSKAIYSYFGQWKNQQVFSLPEGYDKFVELMNFSLETPDGKEFAFVSHLARTDSQVYGSGGSSIIEQLEVEGYESVVFVSDDGWNQLYAWRKIPPIQSVSPFAFGKKERPENNMIDMLFDEDTVYEWQQYRFDSESLTKEALLQLLCSIDLTK